MNKSVTSALSLLYHGGSSFSTLIKPLISHAIWSYCNDTSSLKSSESSQISSSFWGWVTVSSFCFPLSSDSSIFQLCRNPVSTLQGYKTKAWDARSICLLIGSLTASFNLWSRFTRFTKLINLLELEAQTSDLITGSSIKIN